MALVGMVASAAEKKIDLTGENTTIEFTGTKKDGKHDGGFKKLKGSLTTDGTDFTKAKFDVTIETDSLWSDDAKLTGHLKSSDFFDVKTNPTAKFVSTKIEDSKVGYIITGDLTINGKTKSITFTAKTETAEGKFTLKSDFSIDRTDYGMTYGGDKIDNKVALRLKIDAKP